MRFMPLSLYLMSVCTQIYSELRKSLMLFYLSRVGESHIPSIWHKNRQVNRKVHSPYSGWQTTTPTIFKPTAILAKSAALNGILNSSISGFLET